MKATIVDLRYRMKEVMGAIDRGETVIVLHRGKEKAKLTPIVSPSTLPGKGAVVTKDQPLFGMWRDREDLADPGSYVSKLRQSRQLFAPPSRKKRSDVAKRK